MSGFPLRKESSAVKVTVISYARASDLPPGTITHAYNGAASLTSALIEAIYERPLASGLASLLFLAIVVM